MVKSSKITGCRICGSKNMQQVLLLSKMPFTDEFVTAEKTGSEYLADIQIGICGDCGSAQNLNDTDMGEYYNEYTYTVQSSGFAMQFMSTLAQRIRQHYLPEKERPTVLEIGSGSGEQLLEFKKIGFDVLGIEPSDKLSAYANSTGIKTITAFFDENTKEIVDPAFASVDLVISSYTFDHIPRPVEVLKNIHHILNENGLLVLEVHDLSLIKERNEFCLFEHEHYTYLNEATMSYLLTANGFEVVSFDLLSKNEKRANSLLVVARKSGNVAKAAVDVPHEIQDIQHLSVNIYRSIQQLQSWLDQHSGKKIAAYGAGGRGVMTIAALNNYNNIAYIVDKNPKAPHIYAPKSHLPVFNIEELGKNKVDLVIVFSFGYFAEIVEEVETKYNYDKDQFISILDILK